MTDSLSQLDDFMEAVREQESSGNYNDAGGGAYQFETSTWQSAAKAAGVSTTTYPTANSAPAAVQDQVAASLMTTYFNGSGAGSWTKVAELWNGGKPYAVPNPGLGPGATTATYAAQVLARFNAILGGAGTGSVDTGADTSTSDSLLSWPGDIVKFFSTGADDLVDVGKFFSAFFQPSTYVRIGSGAFGVVFLILGIIYLGREAKEGST
jgi:hypothetical protein